MLEVLLTCLLEMEGSISSQQTRDYLTGLNTGKGATKTTKLAKQLVGLKRGRNYDQKYEEAIAHAVERRIERVERWAACRTRQTREVARLP
jgi:hypothetical protein